MIDNPENNKKMVETFVNDVFVNHDFSKLDSYMRDDYIQHNPRVPQGKEGFKQYFMLFFFKAIPDFKYTLEKIVAEGDIVMIYAKATGTHTGVEFLGKAATGNTVDFNIVDIFRIQDGMIAEHWDVVNTFAFYRQLEIIELLMEQEG